MDSPTERMPIACVHCAKAKAKCDKKVSHYNPGDHEINSNPFQLVSRMGDSSSGSTGVQIHLVPHLNVCQDLTARSIGSMFEMCEQTDRVPVKGHSTFFP